MILVDTSALYALASADDPNHAEAVERSNRISESGEPLLVHTYVLSEAFALLNRRHGRETAVRIDSGLRRHETVAVDRTLHHRGVARLAGEPARVSLVDAVSFEVMEERGIEVAFAFDPDFERAGFRLYDGS